MDTTALVLATVLLNKAKARGTCAALQVNGLFAFHIGVLCSLLNRCRWVRDVSTSDTANVLLPKFPQESEHDRANNEPDKSKHFEAAEAAHQYPDEAQSNSVARDNGPHDLVATKQNTTAQAE